MRARQASGSRVIEGRALGSSMTTRSPAHRRWPIASRVVAMGSSTKPSVPVSTARARRRKPAGERPGSTAGADVALGVEAVRRAAVRVQLGEGERRRQVGALHEVSDDAVAREARPRASARTGRVDRPPTQAHGTPSRAIGADGVVGATAGHGHDPAVGADDQVDERLARDDDERRGGGRPRVTRRGLTARLSQRGPPAVGPRTARGIRATMAP